MTIRDLPDNYPWLPGSVRYPLADLGELAARLGSPVVFDRRGEVLWMDTFNISAAKWKEENGGNDGTLTFSRTLPLIDTGCMVMTSPSAAGTEISAVRYLNPIELNKWGIELAFAFVDAFTTFDVELDWADGVNIWHAAFRVTHASEDVKYMVDLTTWQKFADLEIIVTADSMFNRVKMVADFENEKYLRVIINQNEYDLSDIALLKRTSSVGPYSHIILTYNGIINIAGAMKVDAVIITSNEP